jgi:hypothetical protein
VESARLTVRGRNAKVTESSGAAESIAAPRTASSAAASDLRHIVDYMSEGAASEGKRIVVTSPPRRRTLATAYLTQAVEALRNSLSSDTLYDSSFRATSREERTEHWTYVATGMAHLKRTTFVQTAMLFSALAAEAYANEFVREHFPNPQALMAVDQWKTLDKLVLAPRLALGEPVFERGQEPIQTVARLFKRRNALVHPKPQDDEPTTALDADPVYSPVEAARMIVAVADAARRLVRAGRLGDGFDTMVHSILSVRSQLVLFGQSGMGAVPHPHAPPQPEHLLSGLSRGAGWRPAPTILTQSDCGDVMG